MSRPETPTESPAELTQRIAAGERGAEARLVERYARGVRIVLARHTRRAEEAEDLFQETFQLAVSKLRAGELRDASKLGAFLSSLAKNLAIEHYRKSGRRQTEADSETAEAASTFAAGQLGDLLRDEEARLVRHTLEELSTDRDREILFRFYIAEEDRDTIAADYGLDGPQLNRILYRARQRYKALYLERLETLGHARAAAAVLFAFFLTAGAIGRLFASLKS